MTPASAALADPFDPDQPIPPGSTIEWLFDAIALTALVGVFGCAVSVVLRPVVTGMVCEQGRSGAESRPLLLFLAVGVVAGTFWVLGA